MEGDANDLNDQQFTCEICIEPTSKRFKNADKCSHPFCTDCIISYIRAKLDDNNVGRIECPALNCNHTLEPSACAPISGPKLFVRWMDVLCEEAIVKQEKCYCPNRTCSVAILNECGEDPNKSKCPNCKKWFCFHCKSFWHAGFKCAESNQYRDVNDAAFGQLVESENWTRCPGCRHFIERTEGCPVMKCRCGVSFCYIYGKHPCSCYAPTQERMRCVDVTILCTGFFFVVLFILWLDPFGDHQFSDVIKWVNVTIFSWFLLGTGFTRPLA